MEVKTPYHTGIEISISMDAAVFVAGDTGDADKAVQCVILAVGMRGSIVRKM